MNGMHLSRLPVSGKLFCTLFLAGIGLGAIAAFVQASTAVGISPAAVQSSLAPEMAMTRVRDGEMSAEKEIDLGEISDEAKVWIRTPLLIQTSHTHLFSQTLIAGLLGLIFLGTSVRDRVKAMVVALPFVGTFLDIGGMWLTRFLSPSLSFLVVAGGTMFALGYVLITALSLRDLWLAKETP
jgi:hypothetical protein